MKLKKLFKLGALALMIPAFASCSVLNKNQTALREIENITYAEDDTGQYIIVTIHYSDETINTFPIPKGEHGEDGVSITGVEASTNEETGVTTVIVHYDNGEDGKFTFTTRSIKEIHQEVVDDHLELTIEYTDGSFSDTYTIYNGVNGKDGVGVDHLTEPVVQDDGSVKFTIVLTNGEETEVTIPQGPKGTGIDHIESGVKDNQYYLTIYLTDGTNSTVWFDIPSQWHNVQEKPSPSDFKIGDYAFDIIHHKIYYKDETGTWVIVADFDTNDTKYTVYFDLNADDAKFATGKSEYDIYSGQTFISSKYTVPIATRPNYTFGGWCTSKDPNPTNGYFTDLTPVLSTMTLYAVWNN